MRDLRATERGYIGGRIIEVGEVIAWPHENTPHWLVKPGYAKPEPFGGKGDHDGDGKVGGSLPHGDKGQSSPPAGPVVVPADWSSLHHAKRKALAKEISGEAVDGADAADKIIAAYVEATKPAPFSDAPEPQTVKEAQAAAGGMQPDWVAPGSPKPVSD